MGYWAHAVFEVAQNLTLLYFVLLNILYALFSVIGVQIVRSSAREISKVALRDLLERDVYKPVSILVPAYNEQDSIVASVGTFLSMNYPELEVIVAVDGATDETLSRMVAAFALVEQPRVFRLRIETQPVRRLFRSSRHPNLYVVEKENGGRADALNAALNLAHYPLICAVDADSLLDAQAVLRASRLFVHDDTLMGVGGTIRPMNGAVLRGGRVMELRMPATWVERFQIIEYARAFFIWRAAWSRFDALLIISGAFGLLRREEVLRVGGYRADTVAEDMELIVRMHRYYRDRGLPYRLAFSPDPICWTEVPPDLRSLRSQRNRWHRGLWETLWLHRDMLFNPRYGRIGMLALPYFLCFEALGPVVEVLGYVTIVVSYLVGILFIPFTVLFIFLAVIFGMVLSQSAVGVETLLLARYPRVRDRLTLFAAAFLENLGFRQVLTLERFIAAFQTRQRRGRWGPAITRKGIPEAEV